jgi:hypothetical protein
LTEADRLGLALSGLLAQFDIESTYVDELRAAEMADVATFVLTCSEIIRAVVEATTLDTADHCTCDACMPSIAIH